MAGKKSYFPGRESGKYPGGGGKKLKSKTLDNCPGHCSIFTLKYEQKKEESSLATGPRFVDPSTDTHDVVIGYIPFLKPNPN